MISIKLENLKGEILEFTQNSPFSIVDIQGLSPTDATINTSETALIDGGKFNSSKVNLKQMIVAFSINRDAAQSRIEIYRVLKTKQFVKFYYTGYYRDVYIEGYIDSINITHFDMKQMCTVSFLCPSPFFREAQEIINDIDNVVSTFSFPFAITEAEPIPLGYIDAVSNITINNNGDVGCGMVIEIYARNLVINPKVFNYVTAEYIGVNYTMQMGDVIYIDTKQGKKTIQLLRNGEYTNIFNSLMRGSTWLQLDAGENIFTHEVDEGIDNVQITFKHSSLYEGV